MIRQMKGESAWYKGDTLKKYNSAFDTETGTIVRQVELDTGNFGNFIPRSPSPETVDISITNRCGMGCSYCYQSSVPGASHGHRDLVETILKGFTHIPYQIALGGGEPTLHPEFPYILRRARELGTIPNYTTAGYHMTGEIIKATNEVCGGVAMTYHAFKGQDWFGNLYGKIRRNLTCQVNVHLIADKDVVTNLDFLVKLQDKVGKINIVLLAYYPDVGRASLVNMLTKQVYLRELPDALNRASDSGMNIAFSEGLIPYFLSRPELPINTDFAIRSEGVFTCYFDHQGRCSQSSFDPDFITTRGYNSDCEICKEQSWNESCPKHPNIVHTVWNTLSQELWEKIQPIGGSNGKACYNCKHSNRCATPHSNHYLTCAYAEHNQ